ncbi:hypothetical protein AB0O18_20155 [Streptomyces sp. NPDC093224]|uniref:hypothetical protein n=1 Tax=Streptomyces sp. NPDC093224 TaxID=3155198 RepID=UPI0034148B80
MNSFPSNSSDNDGSPGNDASAPRMTDTVVTPAPSDDFDAMNATYGEMLDRAEADIRLLRRAVRRRRKALRRQARRRAAGRVSPYRRPVLLVLGGSFFVAGVLMLITGQPSALDMFDRAMTAWSAAFVVDPRP